MNHLRPPFAGYRVVVIDSRRVTERPFSDM